MSKAKQHPTPEDLFAQALRDNNGKTFSPAEMRLLTTGLTALQTHRERPLRKMELQSVKAMIAYIAYSQGTEERGVEDVVTSYFDVKTIDTLLSYRYQEIIEYLVGLKMKEVVN